MLTFICDCPVVAPDAPEQDPEAPIGGRELQTFRCRPPQHSELLPQGEVLQPELNRGFTQRDERAQHDEQASPDGGEEQVKFDQLK
jgi:hypothetical protein